MFKKHLTKDIFLFNCVKISPAKSNEIQIYLSYN